MARYLVASAADMPLDSLRLVDAGGVPICLAHAEDGEFYAINDVCTHEDFSLSMGELWDHEVECPQHASRFDLRTGAVRGMPAVIPVDTYPVTVEDGDVYVEV